MSLFNRYNPAKRFARLLYQAKQFIETAEWNEQISIHEERDKAIGDSAFGAISLREGGNLAITVETRTVRLTEATVWAGGYMHRVPAATLTDVPMTGVVAIGVAVTNVEITPNDDPSLKGVVDSTITQGKDLANRLRYDCQWSMVGDPFYPIFTIIDGFIQNEVVAPSNDAAELLVERHVFETHGSHVVDGFGVSSAGFDDATDEQIYVIKAGVVRAQGRRVTRTVDQRYRRKENPTLVVVNGETFLYEAGGVIPLNNGPIESVSTVTVVKEETVNITHQLAGGTDASPFTPLYSIEQVTQLGTTYSNGTDFKRTGDGIDWSPGGQEPAPGSTYTARIRYIATVTPLEVGRDFIRVENAVVGQPATVNYRFKLPRTDILAIDLDGNLQYLEGLSNRYSPTPPRVPSALAPLVRIRNEWGIEPIIEDVGQRKLTEADTQALIRTFLDYQDLVSQLQLERDIQERDPASRRGSFVDPFDNDLQRDLGIAQDAAIFGGIATLPIVVMPRTIAIGSAAISLPFVTEAVLSQPFRTGSQKINEFQAFEPLPAQFKISPAVDRWNVTSASTISTATASISQVGVFAPETLGTPLYGTVKSASTQSSTTTRLTSRRVEEVQFLRQIAIGFEANRFGPGENLQRVLFDGIDVTASVTGAKVADATGKMSGTFTIPPNIRTGTKEVQIIGAGGSHGATSFTGQGTITHETYVRNTKTLTTLFIYDPVAQSFKLTEPRQLTGVKVEFTARGDASKPVALELRPVLNGLPTTESIAEGSTSGNFIIGDPLVAKPENWTEIAMAGLPLIQPGDEYAFALLTDDANHSVAIAQLGAQTGNAQVGFDKRLQQWVRSNPAGGVLYKGPNGSAWLVVPDSDMTHQIMAARYTSTSRVVPIGTFNTDTIDAGGISDLLVLLMIQEPSVDTRVSLRLTRASGEVVEFEPNQPLRLDEFLHETIHLDMILTGTATLSPVVAPECQILFGRMKTAATYVSQAIEVDQTGGDAKFRTVLEAVTPGTSSVAVKVGAPGAFTAQTAIKAVAVGDGWIEREYLQNPYTAPLARIEIDLAGTPKNRPMVRNLRARATEV